MSKSHFKPNSPMSAETLIQEEALRVARSIQKPGQTKEQTKLIAQGVAQGITLYKKQQSAKAREQDKMRKRAFKRRTVEAEPMGSGAGTPTGLSFDTHGTDVAALLTGSGLFALMALVHLVRAFAGWSVVIAGWTVPLWMSWVVLPMLLSLSVWLFFTARRA